MATDRQRLKSALQDADYPADKDTLVAIAERAGADGETVAALRAMPREQYESFVDVASAVELDAGEDQAGKAEPVKAKARDKNSVAESMTEVSDNPIVQELGENRGS